MELMKSAEEPWRIDGIGILAGNTPVAIVLSNDPVDMRLIAAAPSLLKALKGMVAAYGHQFNTGSVALDNAIAAIRETEGNLTK